MERERAVIPPAFTDEVTLSRLMSDALYWPPPIQLINHFCGHCHSRHYKSTHTAPVCCSAIAIDSLLLPGVMWDRRRMVHRTSLVSGLFAGTVYM